MPFSVWVAVACTPVLAGRHGLSLERPGAFPVRASIPVVLKNEACPTGRNRTVENSCISLQGAADSWNLAMGTEQDPAIDALLARIRSGDAGATAQLLDIAYNELRGIAGNLFNKQANGHTLQPTALVNEVCLRLLKSPKDDWNDTQHFYRVAARAMRHLLIDHARAKRSQKRQGEGVRVSLEVAEGAAGPREVDLIALDDTLTKLATMDNRLAEVFELRFLVGLSVDRTAEALGVSARTVELDTRLIRAWLQRELYGDGALPDR